MVGIGATSAAVEFAAGTAASRVGTARQLAKSVAVFRGLAYRTLLFLMGRAVRANGASIIMHRINAIL